MTPFYVKGVTFSDEATDKLPPNSALPLTPTEQTTQTVQQVRYLLYTHLLCWLLFGVSAAANIGKTKSVSG